MPCFFILGYALAFASADTADLITRTEGIADDVKKLGDYILHPDKRAMIKLVSTGAATAFLAFIDDDIRHEVKKRSGDTLDAMERIFEPMGRWEVQGLFGSGVLGAGYILKDKKMAESSLTGLEAYLISGTLVEAIKLISGRERPYKEEGKDAFFEGGVSFPSGHAARSFAWAAVFSEYYHESNLVHVLSYGLATMVSLSRLESDRHWLSDVFFGACLGFSIGKGLSHIHLKSTDPPVAFSPIVTEDSIMISSGFNF